MRRIGWLGVWASVIAAGSAGAVGPGELAGFDVVLVTLDTVRPDHLGCYGGEARTPAIDRLAAEGVRFEDAVTPVPITLPAHASLLTGLEVPNHGVRNNGMYRLEEDGPTTLAEALGGAGYDTAAFVSAIVLEARYGLDRGFDLYDDELEADAGMSRMGHLNRRPADAVTDRALSWLAAREGDAPAFLWVHYFDAHMPYEVPVEDQPAVGGNTYDGAIGFVDIHLARLFDAVREGKRAERTLIVLTSDHGEGLGEHGESSHSRLIYDSTMRVPLIVWAPDAIDPGVDDDRYVGLIDIMPTVLDLVGAEFDGPLDGRSMLDPVDPERAIYMETLAGFLNNGWAPLYGLRQRDGKYIRAPKPEYYDLDRDPGELSNRFSKGPDELEVLVPELDRRLALWPGADAASAAAATMSPDQIERLRSLGYVGGGGDQSQEEAPDPKDMIVAWEKANEGVALSAAGDHGGGLNLIIESIKLNPRDAQAWQNAALVHQRLNRFSDAEFAIRRAIKLVPTAERFVKLGQYLLMQRKLDDAEEALDEAESIDDREGGIYLTRGQLLCAKGQFDLACPLFEKAIEIDPVISGPMAEKMLIEARKRLPEGVGK